MQGSPGQSGKVPLILVTYSLPPLKGLGQQVGTVGFGSSKILYVERLALVSEDLGRRKAYNCYT